MRILVACAGRCRDEHLLALSRRYEERLARMTSLEVVEVPAAPGALPRAKAQQVEAEALRKVLGLPPPPGGASSRRGRARPQVAGGPRAVVALDERGETPGSRELAGMLADWTRRGVAQACFLVGGDEGLDETLIEAADRVLALSRLTLTHEFARVVLLEQLYRGHAILAGHPYHRA